MFACLKLGLGWSHVYAKHIYRVSFCLSSGVVCGVQSSIQSSFETLSFLAGTFLRSPNEFWALCLASLCTVGCSVLLFAQYMFGIFMAHGQPIVDNLDGEEQLGLLEAVPQSPAGSELSLLPTRSVKVGGAGDIEEV